MNAQYSGISMYRSVFNVIITLAIIVSSVYILHRFIPSLLWASLILVMTYPRYEKWLRFCGFRPNLAAMSFTSLITLILFLPFIWIIYVLVDESQVVIHFIFLLNEQGMMPPAQLTRLPVIGNDVLTFWQHHHLADPGGIKTYLASLNLSLTHFSFLLREIGFNLFHRSFQLGFTLLSLFFFYRDKDQLFSAVNRLGQASIGERWQLFVTQFTNTLQGTVSGTLAVGAGVGLIMGLLYYCLGFSAPAIGGFFTAIGATVPFVVPFVFIIIALLMWLSSGIYPALTIVIVGTLVMFIADHFVKPTLIGGNTKLHFLAVLFGLLGGIEVFGLIGLFLGPICLVLLFTVIGELSDLGFSGRRISENEV